jgi:hypothetical protein
MIGRQRGGFRTSLDPIRGAVQQDFLICRECRFPLARTTLL